MKHDADIAISADLQSLFKIPTCDLLGLPKAEKLRVRLPNGGEFQALADISKGIPTDCSLSMSLMLQISPLLANMACILAVVGLVKPVMDLLNALQPPVPNIPKALGVVPEIATKFKAFVDSCIAPYLPPYLPIAKFLIDLLNIILKLLHCVIGQLKTVLAMMKGINLRINEAEAAGNTELAKVLECARENAALSAAHTASSMGPLSNIIELIGPLLQLLGQNLSMPGPGSTEDTEALEKTIQSLDDVVTNIKQIVEILEQLI